ARELFQRAHVSDAIRRLGQLIGRTVHRRDYTDPSTAADGTVTKLTAAQLDELAAGIKQLGRDLGFTKLGVAGTALADDEALLERWLTAGRHGQMAYMERHGTKRSRPSELLPGTVRVISARM